MRYGKRGPHSRPSGPIDLIFLHATGFCALTYRTLLQRLGSERRAVALDLRGHGHTTLPAHPFKLTDWYGYAADVVAIVEAMNRGGGFSRRNSLPGQPGGMGGMGG